MVLGPITGERRGIDEGAWWVVGAGQGVGVGGMEMSDFFLWNTHNACFQIEKQQQQPKRKHQAMIYTENYSISYMQLKS